MSYLDWWVVLYIFKCQEILGNLFVAFNSSQNIIFFFFDLITFRGLGRNWRIAFIIIWEVLNTEKNPDLWKDVTFSVIFNVYLDSAFYFNCLFLITSSCGSSNLWGEMDSLSETLLFSRFSVSSWLTALSWFGSWNWLDLLDPLELILSDLKGVEAFWPLSRLKWALFGAGTLMDPSLIFPATIYPLGGKLSFPVASLLVLVPVLSALALLPA